MSIQTNLNAIIVLFFFTIALEKITILQWYSQTIMENKLSVPIRQSIKIQIATTVFFSIALIFIIGALGGVASVYLRENNLWHRSLSFGWISGILVTLLAVFIIIYRIRKIIAPLSDLTIVAKKFGSGDLQARSNYKSKNEIGILSRTFNNMADQLSEKIAALQNSVLLKDEFIGITSHNLKTPLIIIRGQLEKLMMKKDSLPEDIRDSIISINSQADRLKFINDRLLSIVKIQGDLLKLNIQNQDIVNTVSQVIDSFKEQIDKKSLKLEVDLPTSPLLLSYDEEWIKESLENIISNAIKYTPEKGVLKVTVSNTSNFVKITLSDTGIGISKEEQNKLFQPFHRAQDILDYNYEGLGLGLYIVKLIIEKHNGSINLTSEEGKGTIVNISLPLKENA